MADAGASLGHRAGVSSSDGDLFWMRLVCWQASSLGRRHIVADAVLVVEESGADEGANRVAPPGPQAGCSSRRRRRP